MKLCYCQENMTRIILNFWLCKIFLLLKGHTDEKLNFDGWLYSHTRYVFKISKFVILKHNINFIRFFRILLIALASCYLSLLLAKNHNWKDCITMVTKKLHWSFGRLFPFDLGWFWIFFAALQRFSPIRMAKVATCVCVCVLN